MCVCVCGGGGSVKVTNSTKFLHSLLPSPLLVIMQTKLLARNENEIFFLKKISYSTPIVKYIMKREVRINNNWCALHAPNDLVIHEPLPPATPTSARNFTIYKTV